jgi:purine-binding chemotaxis protein CheW
VLRERARALAAPEEEQRPQKLSTSIVTFEIGDKSFAVEPRFMLSAAPAPPLVSVPGVGAPLEGLCLVRGQILPVFDLLELLDLPSRQPEGRPLLAIFGTEQPEFAVAVDMVLPSRDVPVESIQELNSGEPRSPGLVRGIADDGIVVLDGEILLNHPALFF